MDRISSNRILQSLYELPSYLGCGFGRLLFYDPGTAGDLA